ncbi:MAG TPA: outer membrane lipoprotein carrier protein LolA [Terriglobales bacterium]|jgi:outer membrane lipoprotein-sorting protein|nr:outer membrane lipoprotein carrier protein LolA [Terriglobales bacterium]
MKNRSMRVGVAGALLAGALGCLATRAAAQADPVQKVLNQMDAAAASFRTTQANFEWEQYWKVVNDRETQKGTVYYRRSGKEIQMMADIADPPKSVLFSEGKVQVYEPKLKRVTSYEAGKNREAVESFLVLGFGGSGHDMLKSFDVKYLGDETVAGVSAAKLELVPKSERVRNIFAKIWLWIDPARGVSVQQQFFEPSGDYRLAKYSDIELNQKIPDAAFRLKTSGDTKHIEAPKG